LCTWAHNPRLQLPGQARPSWVSPRSVAFGSPWCGRCALGTHGAWPSWVSPRSVAFGSPWCGQCALSTHGAWSPCQSVARAPFLAWWPATQWSPNDDEVCGASNPTAQATRRYTNTSMGTTGRGSSPEQLSGWRKLDSEEE
jgi:hypothetical protein